MLADTLLAGRGERAQPGCPFLEDEQIRRQRIERSRPRLEGR